MTNEEYNARMHTLNEDHKEDIRNLAREFAITNNSVKIGDIIEDHYQLLLVDKIGLYLSIENPEYRYHGVRLTKKFKPFKSGETSTVCQCNLKVNHGHGKGLTR